MGEGMTDHLNELRHRLARESARLAAATKPREIEIRTVWVKQYKREIASEIAFLAKRDPEPEMTDDELLAALEA